MKSVACTWILINPLKDAEKKSIKFGKNMESKSKKQSNKNSKYTKFHLKKYMNKKKFINK